MSSLINFLFSSLCCSHQLTPPLHPLFCLFSFFLNFPLIICPFLSRLAVFVECMKQNILMDVWTAWDVSAWELPPCDKELWQGIETITSGKNRGRISFFSSLFISFPLSGSSFSVVPLPSLSIFSHYFSVHTNKTHSLSFFWISRWEGFIFCLVVFPPLLSLCPLLPFSYTYP